MLAVSDMDVGKNIQGIYRVFWIFTCIRRFSRVYSGEYLKSWIQQINIFDFEFPSKSEEFIKVPTICNETRDYHDLIFLLVGYVERLPTHSQPSH